MCGCGTKYNKRNKKIMTIETKYSVNETVCFKDEDGEVITGYVTSVNVHAIDGFTGVSYGVRAGSGQYLCAEAKLFKPETR